MIGVLKKIWRFAGKEQANIGKSIFWGFFYAVFHMLQVAAIYFVVLALTGGEQTSRAAWLSLLLLAVSIVGRALVNRFTQLQQTHAGYFMVADRRVAIGDKLKRVPMGYFSDRSLGEITGVTTTVLRPTGMAEFEGVKLNVVADGEYIPKDARVRVDHVEGARVVVRRLRTAEE